MKKIILLAASIISLSACQKIKNAANISFDVPYTQTVTLPPVPGYTYGTPLPSGGADLPFAKVSLATNAQQYFDQYHASRANVVSAFLTQLDMQITNPANQNFDFLDRMELYISTESQPEVLVAYQYSIPKGSKKIDLVIVQGLDIKNYADADSVTVRLNAHVNAVPIPGTQVYSEGNFHITANPLN